MVLRSPTEIALRAFTERSKRARKTGNGKNLSEPSGWTLVFDTETTVCAAQKLRIGSYQIRKYSKLHEQGLFYDPETVSETGLSVLRAYAAERDLELITVETFRRHFIKYGYKLNGVIIGFNLPFDISRIAFKAGPAKGHMRGGFSFLLFPYRDQPAVRVKHLSARQSIIDFAAPGKSRDTRGMRNRRISVSYHRGFFIDVKTIAAALTSRSFSLESLCKFLKVETRKEASDEHGGPITPDYLDYAMADAQATWECFVSLYKMYSQHDLNRPLHKVLSEASIGKGYLDKMGIKPLLECRPDIPREIFGRIMGSYYGGRTETRLRKAIERVLYTDFKSMYPTVNALIGLWDFVIGDGFSWYDSTENTRAFLATVGAQDFQQPQTWKRLRTLVRLAPDKDLLPTRAKYNGKTHTIGLNYLTCETPIWFTLADVVAAKLLSGKTPTILEASTFEPGPPQDGLQAIDLFGNPDFHVDPLKDDVFNRLIDLRDVAKAAKDENEKAIKIIANATSYGIFIETQRDDAPKPEALNVYNFCGDQFEIQSQAIEQPGNYFHPLLGTLITGAARLMLALAEHKTLSEGLGWVFCDTDSLAIAKPADLAENEFIQCAQRVIDWFERLNPYQKSGSILQLEDVNFTPGHIPELRPLYAYALSSKRYALFNLDEEKTPIIRKASAHGLGLYLDPYGQDDLVARFREPAVPLSEIGVRLWQYDLWFHILRHAQRGETNVISYDFHPALNHPARIRYGATSPEMLRWMSAFNDDKLYRDQIKPFGFLLMLPPRMGVWSKPTLNSFVAASTRGRPKKTVDIKPIAPFERDGALLSGRVIDRVTGDVVSTDQLKTYAECLSRYHLSPEDKFLNADYGDTGETLRRHVTAESIRLIGKEANRIGEAGEADPISKSILELNAG